MRWVLALLAIGASVLAPGQRQLVKLNFFVDGRAVAAIGPVRYTEDLYLVPLRDALSILVGQMGQVEKKGNSCEVSLDGMLAVRLPLTADASPYAEIYGLGAEGGQPTRRIALQQPPIELPDAPGRLMMDLHDIGAMLGVTVDIELDRVSLYTAAYWCRVLGLTEEVATNRLLRNLNLMPDFGISPPAKTLITWVRPTEGSFVQIFRVGSGKPEPMFYKSPVFGDWVTYPQSGYRAAWRPSGPKEPARTESMFFDFPEGTFGAYVALVCKQDLGYEDPIAAINTGKLRDGEWTIVGLRQRVLKTPVMYDVTACKSGDTIESLATKHKMDADLFRELNGIAKGDPPELADGRRVITIAGINEDALREFLKADYEVVGLHEAQPGQTISSVCADWGVTVRAFSDANPQIPAGAELEPGELVKVIRMKGGPPVKPSAQIEAEEMGAVGITTKAVDIRQSTSPDSQVLYSFSLPKPVMVLAEIPDRKQYQISVTVSGNEVVGFVPVDAVKITDAAGPAAGDGEIAQEALKWIGTPYDWGGNNLSSGIDCSHFVAAVLQRAGRSAPPAPVVQQETRGEFAHRKPGPYRRNGRNYIYNGPLQPLNRLGDGDRVIIQYAPLNDRPGSRHTGVYIGPLLGHPRFGNVKYAIVHASSSRGVTVNDLMASYLWRNYRFSLRDEAPGQRGSTKSTDALVAEAAARLLRKK